MTKQELQQTIKYKSKYGTLFNVDCIELLKSLPSESIDLIATDPPYKTTPYGNCDKRTMGGMAKNELTKKGKIFEHNDIDIKDWIGELYRVLKPQSHCYIMCNNKNLKYYLNEIENANFVICKTLIWDKGNSICNQFYMDSHEYIIFCRKGKAKKINNCGTKSILSIPNKKTKDENGKNLHDTEKPIELMKILIENSSQENDIVLDPFVGVGSTALACIKSSRKFICCELDEHYSDIAKERIEGLINE